MLAAAPIATDPMNQQALNDRLDRLADQCVKCGLCIPHCPTYRLRLDEAESPRGRIALIQGLAQGRLADSPRLRDHLASCLECRACEVACPSLVQVGALMVGARALTHRNNGPWRRWRAKAWLDVLASPEGTRVASRLAAFYRRTGLARLAERTGLARWPGLGAYHRVARQLGTPARPASLRAAAEATGDEVELFLGCVARSAQPGALAAAQRVLERLGYRVRVAPGQGCCGAMHRHNGLPEAADRLLGRTASAASGRLMIGIASACVAELKSDPDIDAREICRFLADLAWPSDLRLRPLERRIAVHEPCSHRNQLRDATAAYDLLRRLPGAEPVALPDNAFCCGAAGTYLLQQPATSRALLAPKLEALAELGAEILVTTNTGCALHLAAGVREAGLAVEVLHPLELIARQLGDEVEHPVRPA